MHNFCRGFTFSGRLLHRAFGQRKSRIAMLDAPHRVLGTAPRTRGSWACGVAHVRTRKNRAPGIQPVAPTPARHPTYPSSRGGACGCHWQSGLRCCGQPQQEIQNREPRELVKYASAHDLRRAFGERWARRVMPQDLMELMRHESIDTTMRYYVGRNAQDTAKRLWEAYRRTGNTSGNRTAKSSSAKKKAPTQNVGTSGLSQ
jgi:hypothetical protein